MPAEHVVNSLGLWLSNHICLPLCFWCFCSSVAYRLFFREPTELSFTLTLRNALPAPSTLLIPTGLLRSVERHLPGGHLLFPHLPWVQSLVPDSWVAVVPCTYPCHVVTLSSCHFHALLGHGASQICDCVQMIFGACHSCTGRFRKCLLKEWSPGKHLWELAQAMMCRLEEPIKL